MRFFKDCAQRRYRTFTNLRDVSGQITADVLITAGEKDHFCPVEQVYKFEKALTNARSVTTRIFTEDEGGHEHCQ